MKKVLLIGKQSDQTKELSDALSAGHSVQTLGLEPSAIYEVLGVFAPDVVVILLEGAHESTKAVLRHINTKCSGTPVITLGTEAQRAMFSQYYKESQFENIIYPADSEKVIAAVDRRLSDGTLNIEAVRPFILIVDDDMAVLRSVKSMLESDYETAVAPSGPAALKMIEKRHPDLVLLDYEMPNMDGRQMLEKLRESDRTKSLPVVFLTAITDSEYIDAILGLDPQGYIVKPADPIRLKETVEKVLYYL